MSVIRRLLDSGVQMWTAELELRTRVRACGLCGSGALDQIVKRTDGVAVEVCMVLVCATNNVYA